MNRKDVWRVVLAAMPAVLDLSARFAFVQTLQGEDLAVYLATTVLSTVLWFLLLGARSWIGTITLAAFAWFTLGEQVFTYMRYRSYLDADAILVGTSIAPHYADVRYAGARAVGLFAPIIIALAAHVWLRSGEAPRKRWRSLDGALALALVLMFVSPARGARQGRSPEALALAAYGQLSRALWDKNETVLRVHPAGRSPVDVPKVSSGERKRSVLVILNESVRAASTCTAYDPNCKLTPFSNEAAKSRIPLMQMRALDSTTAISLLVYFAGLLPTVTRSQALSAPWVWEYARAAGYETGYYTSQNVLFGNQGKLIENIQFSRSKLATELEWAPDLDTGADDGAAADALLRDAQDAGNLHAPFFSVLHFCNTHYPYRIEDADLPLLPQSSETGPYYKTELWNRYHDALYHQDRALAKVVDSFKDSKTPVVIVYLSDHGEQLHEHYAHGHTGTVYDAEIRVPMWVWSTPGALSPEEESTLRAIRDKPLFGIDVLPTLLDLLGIWQAPELRELQAPMPGQSLLRGGSPLDRTWPLTNCTELWGCAYRNWGVMRGNRKLFRTQGDTYARCLDTAAYPNEDKESPVCDDLVPDFLRLGIP